MGNRLLVVTIIGCVSLAAESPVYAAPSPEMETAARFGLEEKHVRVLVEAAPYARLSADVYRQNIEKGEKTDDGWVVLHDKRLGSFHATAYSKENEIVVVFEGTRPPGDVIADVASVLDPVGESLKMEKRDVAVGMKMQAQNAATKTAKVVESAKESITTLSGEASNVAEAATARYQSAISAAKQFGESVKGGFEEVSADARKVNEFLGQKNIAGALGVIGQTAKDVNEGANNLADAAGDNLTEFGRDVAGGAREVMRDAERINEGAQELVSDVGKGFQQYGYRVAGGATELVKDWRNAGESVSENYLTATETALDVGSDIVIGDIYGTLVWSVGQNEAASNFASEIIAMYPQQRIVLAGHSLGGSLAQTSALFNDKVSAVYAFNSAPLGLVANLASTEEELTRVLSKTSIIREKGEFLSLGSPWNAGVKVPVDFIEGVPIFDSFGQHSMETLSNNLEKVSAFYNQAKERVMFERVIAGMQNQLSAITQGGSSHIGSAAYFIGRSPAQDSVREGRNTIAHVPTIRETSEYTNGFIIQAPVDLVLRWDATPADLDSHLTGPATANPNDAARFHTYFDAPGSLGTAPQALLYHDDTDSFGPEQTRINVVQPGVYRFYVHDYTNRDSTNSTAMSNSGAVVTLHHSGTPNLPEGQNLGPKVAEISIPTNKVGTVWQAFELDSRTGILNKTTTFSNVSDPASVHFNQ